MATAKITIVLPTSRTDGSAFSPNDYGGFNLFKDGTALTTVNAPDVSFTDPNVVPSQSVYTAEIFDKQTPPVVSQPSSPVTAPAIPVTVLAAPNVPGLNVEVSP